MDSLGSIPGMGIGNILLTATTVTMRPTKSLKFHRSQQFFLKLYGIKLNVQLKAVPSLRTGRALLPYRHPTLIVPFLSDNVSKDLHRSVMSFGQQHTLQQNLSYPI